MHLYSLLPLSFVFLTACPGHIQTNLPRESINTPKTFRVSQPKLVRTQGIPSGNVHCDLQDRAGNIWFSTSGEGVYRYNGKTFINFTKQDGLPDNDVRAIIEDRAGNILFGTRSGICKYDGNTFSNYAGWSDQSITCLLEDRTGSLWFGTMDSGVYRYDGQALTNFLNDGSHSFNLGNHTQLIMDILEDKTGNIWFSSWNGGGVWRYDGKVFTNFLPSADYYRRNEDGRSIGQQVEPTISNHARQESIADDMIFSIAEDRKGNLWFATRRHGACRYDKHFFATFGEEEGFVNYGIYSILEDKKGNIWLTTDRNGVWRYDGKTFKNFTTDNGLINNSVFSVLEDRSGNLWFGTRGFGLSRYDGNTFTSFSETEK